MGLLSKVYNLVWHGDCDDPDCETLDLTVYKDQIDFVFQVSDINSGWKHWSAETDSISLGDFAELYCGIPYIIKLKSEDNVSPNETLEIPNIVVGNFADELGDATPYRITQNCVPLAECSFVIDNIREDRFDLTLIMSSLDPVGTNKQIRAVEIIFTRDVELSDEKVLAISFDEREVISLSSGNQDEADMFKELSNRSTTMVTYGANDNFRNKFGFADFREFSEGMSFEDEKDSVFRFRIPYKNAPGDIKVLKANIFDTSVERKKYDYVLCDPVNALPTPTPTPTITPTATPTATPTPTPADKLWIGFTGEGYYSPFYEVKTTDSRLIKIPFDNMETYNLVRESLNLVEVKEGDTFNINNYVDPQSFISPVKNIKNYEGVNEDYSDFQDVIIQKNDELGFYVDIILPTDYTKFEIVDNNYDKDLYDWANGRKEDKATVSNIQGVMLTASENRPEGSLDEIQRKASFDSYLLSLKCGETWNYELSPIMFANLRFKCFDSQGGEFTAKFGHWGPDHGYLGTGKPWEGANMVYTAPQPTSIMNDASGNERIRISEFYFVRGNSDNKVRLADYNPPGSFC